MDSQIAVQGRYHLHEKMLKRIVREALRKAGIDKFGGKGVIRTADMLQKLDSKAF